MAKKIRFKLVALCILCTECVLGFLYYLLDGGQKPSTQFLIGDNEWVEGWKWYDAIKARKEGTATKEQIEILDRGHWKE